MALRYLRIVRARFSVNDERNARFSRALRGRNAASAGALIVVAAFLVSLFSLPPLATFAQVPNILTIELSKDGRAMVTERLETSTTVSRITVDAITTEVSNILAVDENNEVLSISNEGNLITIDTLGSANVTLTYSAGIVKKVASDIWELNYESSAIQSTVILPSMSEIIYVNDIPIDIVDNIVTMPSGETSLRYKAKSVDAKNFVVGWDEREFPVYIVTASGVQDLGFEQTSKSITLSLDAGAAVLAIIPKELLGGPYSVTTAYGGPVEFKQYYQNSTHSWIRIESSENSTLKIVGTTVIPEFPLVHVAAALTMAFAIILATFRGRVKPWRRFERLWQW